MSLDRSMKELEDMGLFDREMALGTKAHEHLLELEGKTEELKKRRRKTDIPQVCLYCGERNKDKDFWMNHKSCEEPIVVEVKEWPMPSRASKRIVFEVFWRIKNGGPRIYKFKDYDSAMLFRRLLWKEEKPLQEVLKDKRLKWSER